MGWLFVGLGGFLGSVGRYLLSMAIPAAAGFPIATFLINIVGSFALGYLAGLDLAGRLGSANTSLFLRVGLCGGFTTFSTFSVESVRMIEGGSFGLAGLYMASSALLCVLAALAGAALARATAAV